MKAGTFSIIIPVYDTDRVSNCVAALEDQDYKNFEIIFAVNSPKKSTLTWVKKQYGKKYTSIDCGYIPELKNGNKPRALNTARSSAQGEYILYLDSDCMLYPGTLQEYVLSFEAHPEADFVYGDYDVENTGRINGRLFDEYQLKCSNYISGNYPMRSTVNTTWDETLLSLQDWDMWLTAVEHGAKGFYISRPCFKTPAPDSTSISGDSSAHWNERFSTVRTKHNFPVGDTVVTSFGAYNHATIIAEMLHADVRVQSNILTVKPHDFKNIYLLGFYPVGWQDHLRLFHPQGDASKDPVGKNRVIHWIGTDIFQMQHKLSWVAWKNLVVALNAPEYGFKHLCESEVTQKELAELDIKADIVPIPPKEIIPLSPLPDKFTVGIYINQFSDMYYEQMMYEIADAMPDIQFKFFGNRQLVKVEANKEWVGYVDMQEFLPTISAMIRITVHDGLPISPIEALMAGRNVLATFPLEYALKADLDLKNQPDQSKIIEQIRELEQKSLNTQGSYYWQKEMNVDMYKARLMSYFA